jgi:hypothetical protein
MESPLKLFQKFSKVMDEKRGNFFSTTTCDRTTDLVLGIRQYGVLRDKKTPSIK